MSSPDPIPTTLSDQLQQLGLVHTASEVNDFIARATQKTLESRGAARTAGPGGARGPPPRARRTPPPRRTARALQADGGLGMGVGRIGTSARISAAGTATEAGRGRSRRRKGHARVTVPRGRVVGPAGATQEFRSQLLPRYARRTREIDEAILGCYLGGVNSPPYSDRTEAVARRAASVEEFGLASTSMTRSSSLRHSKRTARRSTRKTCSPAR